MHVLAGQRKASRERLVNLMHLPVTDAMAKVMAASVTMPVLGIASIISN